MKILNVSGAPLTGAVVALAQRLLRYGKRCGAVPGADGVLYTLIVKGDQVLVVDGQAFCIVSADGNTVRWKGGTPPFTVAVQTGDLPGTFVNVDETIYTLTEREYSVLTKHEKELIDTDQDWWAADDELTNDEATQTSVGVVIQDSSAPPKTIFAPFGGVPGIYSHFGPLTWCVPILQWGPLADLSCSAQVTPENILNAIVEVPGTTGLALSGTFTYDVDEGAVLDPGLYTLTVIFDAEDSLHYHQAVNTQPLRVSCGPPTLSSVLVQNVSQGYGYDYTIPADAHIVNTIANKPDGHDLTFIASGFSEGGAELTYHWAMVDILSGQPVTWNVSGPLVTFSFAQASRYQWSVYVTDAYGSSAVYTGRVYSFMSRLHYAAYPTNGGDFEYYIEVTGGSMPSYDASHVIFGGTHVNLTVVRATTTFGLKLTMYKTVESLSSYGIGSLQIADSWGNLLNIPYSAWGISGSLPLDLTVSGHTVNISGGDPPYSYQVLGTTSGGFSVSSTSTSVTVVPGCGEGQIEITDSSGASASVDLEQLGVNTCTAASINYVIVDRGHVHVTGGSGLGYNYQIVGATGGTSVWSTTLNDIFVSLTGCYCSGAGLKITDIGFGGTVTISFGPSFGPVTLCRNCSGVGGGGGGGSTWTTIFYCQSLWVCAPIGSGYEGCGYTGISLSVDFNYDDVAGKYKLTWGYASGTEDGCAGWDEVSDDGMYFSAEDFGLAPVSELPAGVVYHLIKFEKLV